MLLIHIYLRHNFLPNKNTFFVLANNEDYTYIHVKNNSNHYFSQLIIKSMNLYINITNNYISL